MLLLLGCICMRGVWSATHQLRYSSYIILGKYVWVWDTWDETISKYGIISKRLSSLGLYIDKQKEINDATAPSFMTQGAGKFPQIAAALWGAAPSFGGLWKTQIHDGIDGVVDFKALFKHSVCLCWRINLDKKSFFWLTPKVGLILELAPHTSQIQKSKKLTTHVKFRHLPSGISQD